MTDSLLPHAPALDEPLEILEACHERIEAQLKTLERLLAHLPQHGADEQARQAAKAILRYFDSAGYNHHEDEEGNLFPNLIARTPADEAKAVQAFIDGLLADHSRMAAALCDVRQQLLPIADGSSTALTNASVEQLTRLYRQHIEKENRELLPLSRRLLTPDDIKAMSQAMTLRRSQKC